MEEDTRNGKYSFGRNCTIACFEVKGEVGTIRGTRSFPLASSHSGIAYIENPEGVRTS